MLSQCNVRPSLPVHAIGMDRPIALGRIVIGRQQLGIAQHLSALADRIALEIVSDDRDSPAHHTVDRLAEQILLSSCIGA